MQLPLIPLDDSILFPGMTATIAADVGDAERVFVLPRPDGEYGRIGTVANVVETGRRSGVSAGRPLWQIARNQTVSDAISEAAAAAERVLDVRAIVAYTQTGNTARLVSRLRPRAPILAFTPHEDTARRINLYWGVTPVLCSPVRNLSELGAHLSRELTARGVARPGDMVVMTGGHPLPDRTGTNFLKVMAVEGAPDLADVASE